MMSLAAALAAVSASAGQLAIVADPGCPSEYDFVVPTPNASLSQARRVCWNEHGMQLAEEQNASCQAALDEALLRARSSPSRRTTKVWLGAGASGTSRWACFYFSPVVQSPLAKPLPNRLPFVSRCTESRRPRIRAQLAMGKR